MTPPTSYGPLTPLQKGPSCHFRRVPHATSEWPLTQLLKGPYAQGRGAGGQWGQLAPTTLKLWGRRPQIWTVNAVHFYFCLFLHVNLGLSQKVG